MKRDSAAGFARARAAAERVIGKKLPPRRAVDCVHLGKKQPGQASSCRGLCFHVCEAGLGVRGTARPGVECQGCPEYEADR